MRRDAIRSWCAILGLGVLGAALVLLPLPAARVPALSIAVPRPVLEVTSTRTSLSWPVRVRARATDADVLLNLRLDGAGADVRALHVALCPAEASSGCTPLVDLHGGPVPSRLALGRITTLDRGNAAWVVVRADLADRAARRPSLLANVTPCAPPRPTELWHRLRTRPGASGDQFQGMSNCATRPLATASTGAALLGAAALAAVLRAAGRRSR